MRWLNKTQLSEVVGLEPDSFEGYRKRGQWLLGIHYSKPTQNTVLYNERLILDWIANNHNPPAHQRAIDRYLTELSANGETPTESTKRQRKRKTKR